MVEPTKQPDGPQAKPPLDLDDDLFAAPGAAPAPASAAPPAIPAPAAFSYEFDESPAPTAPAPSARPAMPAAALPAAPAAPATSAVSTPPATVPATSPAPAPVAAVPAPPANPAPPVEEDPLFSMDDAPAAAAAEPLVFETPDPAKPVPERKRAPVAAATQARAMPSALDMPDMRVDLWECPHCETKNKPERTHCRACGKSPRQPKDAPWFLRPEVALGGVLGLASIGVLVWALLRTDLSLKPPTAASLDSRPRFGTTLGVSRERNGRIFTPKGRMALVGRIAAIKPVGRIPGAVSLVVVLGDEARDPAFADVKATFRDNEVQVTATRWLLIHLLDAKDLERTVGSFISFTGDWGDLAETGILVPDVSQSGSYAVEPDAIRQ